MYYEIHHERYWYYIPKTMKIRTLKNMYLPNSKKTSYSGRTVSSCRCNELSDVISEPEICSRPVTHADCKWHEQSYAYYLTHWGQDVMATVIWTTFSNEFSWMKIFEFLLIFHWSLFPSPGSNWQYASIGSDNGLALTRWQAIIWTNDG